MMIVIYIDDGIGISNDYETALMQTKFVIETLLLCHEDFNVRRSEAESNIEIFMAQ